MLRVKYCTISDKKFNNSWGTNFRGIPGKVEPTVSLIIIDSNSSLFSLCLKLEKMQKKPI